MNDRCSMSGKNQGMRLLHIGIMFLVFLFCPECLKNNRMYPSILYSTVPTELVGLSDMASAGFVQIMIFLVTKIIQQSSGNRFDPTGKLF